GEVILDPAGRDETPDPVAALQGRARRLLHAAAAVPPPESVAVGDARLCGVLVTGAGAIEVAVHGWDVARACGGDHPVPPALAEDLLELVPVLVTGTERPGRFDRPLVPPAGAGPADRLLAFL